MHAACTLHTGIFVMTLRVCQTSLYVISKTCKQHSLLLHMRCKTNLYVPYALLLLTYSSYLYMHLPMIHVMMRLHLDRSRYPVRYASPSPVLIYLVLQLLVVRQKRIESRHRNYTEIIDVHSRTTFLTSMRKFQANCSVSRNHRHGCGHELIHWLFAVRDCTVIVFCILSLKYEAFPSRNNQSNNNNIIMHT